MLANFFGKSNPANLIVLVALFTSYFFANFFMQPEVLQTQALDWVNLIEFAVLYLLLFFFYNFILAKNKLTLHNSFGFMFFVFLFGIFPSAILDKHSLIVSLLLLIYIRRTLSLRTFKAVISKIYDTGFWLGIMFLVEPFSILFVFVAMAMISLFQKLTIRYILIWLTGFITPVLLYFAYNFWFNEEKNILNHFALYTNYTFEVYKNTWFIILLVLTFSITTIVIKTPKIFSISGSFRKYWIWTILCLVCSIFYVFVFPNKTGGELMILFFPVSILLTNLVELVERQLIKNGILVFFFLLSIIGFII